MSASTPTLRRVHVAVKKPSLYICAATILVAASVLTNVALSVKVTMLKGTISAIKERGQLNVGSLVPPIQAKSLDEIPVSITYNGTGLSTVLYVFSPSCGWCARNLANVKDLAQQVDGRFRFVALSLSDDKLREYVTDKQLNFNVYGGISSETRSAYKLGGTPETIVVSSDGRVQKVWYGAYVPDTAQDVEKYFHAQLPGLTEVKK